MTEPVPQSGTLKTCSRCGTRFECGMRSSVDNPTACNGASFSCWCTAFPKLISLSPDQDCYCPACLQALAAGSSQESSS